MANMIQSTIRVTGGGSWIGSLDLAGTNNTVWTAGTNGLTGARSVVNANGSSWNWGYSNLVHIADRALVTNVTSITMSNTYGTLIITNAGEFWSRGAVTIGNGSSNNTATVAGNGALWDLENQNLVIGSGAATGNVLHVDEGGTVQRIGSLILTTPQNEVRLWGGTLSAANAYITDNYLVVGDGQGAGATFGLLGGSIYAGGTGFFAVTNDGTLSGYGTLQQSFTNLGYIVARGGGLTQSVDAVFHGTGTNIAANTGTLVLRADNGAYALNNILDGGTLVITNDNNLGNASSVLGFTSNGGQPFIDATHSVLDGVTDHDYGGDAIKMPASAELVTAYSMTKHGKWITSWNTACASGSDPSVHGEDTSAALERKFRWSARKLIHTADTVPDKIKSIAWFGQGEAFAFDHKAEGVLFTMLLNLRGRLVHLRNDDPLIYGVATIDGTDPLAPRPADFAPGHDLVVALFNDHDTARPVTATIQAPAGTKFSSVITLTPKYAEDGQVDVEPRVEPISGESYLYRAVVPAKSLVALTFPLTGKVPQQSSVTIRQFFSPTVLTDVTASQPSTERIAIKPEALKGATRARLRIVVERLADGEGVALINGKEYRLPKVVTPENAPWIRDIPVAVADLKPQTEVKFQVTSPAHAGYRLATASVLVETE